MTDEKDERDTPTGPEHPDPMMAITARIEGKVDRVLQMLDTFFEHQQEQDARMRALEDGMRFINLSEPNGGA